MNNYKSSFMQFAFVIISNLLIFSCEGPTKLQSALIDLKNKEYEGAKKKLNEIDSTSADFVTAKKLLTKIDSVIAVENLSKYEKEILQMKNGLQTQVDALKEGIDFSKYYKSQDDIVVALVMIGIWDNSIEEADTFTNAEIISLKYQLLKLSKAKKIKEYPRLRQAYGEILKTKLWENDIDVTTSWKGHKRITFTGGMFAANKNKKEFQTQISETVNALRFKRVEYKWYKYDDEYTYYTLETKKDSE